MSQKERNTSPKLNIQPTKVAGSGRPLLTGVLIGLVLGVSLCSGVAIWVARSPSPFTNRALQSMGIVKGSGLAVSGNSMEGVESGVVPTAPGSSGETTTPSSSGPLSKSSSSASPGSEPTPFNGDPPLTAVNPGSALYLQVGAFSTQEDAQKQVETIAQIVGQRARIWPYSAGDAGKVLYRVRLGPFSQTTDTNELVQALKSNAMTYTLVRSSAGESPQ